MAKTIKTFESTLGGFAYRVTSNGNTVSYQEKTPESTSFVTRATEGLAEFQKLAEEKGLFDHYSNKDSPAVIRDRIRELSQ